MRVQPDINEVTSYSCNDISGSINAPVVCYSQVTLRFF